MSRRLRLLLSVLGGLLVATAGTVQAFVPADESSNLAIPRPGSERTPLWNEENLNPVQHPSAAAFEDRVGGTWHYKWNALTGTPHAIYGSGYDLSASPVLTEAQAVGLIETFINVERELLGVNPAELKLHSAVNALGKWGIIFTQVHDGIDVEGSRVRFVLTESGRLYYMSSDWNPNVRLDTSPALTQQVAIDIAGRGVGFTPGHDTATQTADLLILPVPEEGSMGYRLTWRTRHEISDPYAIWTSYVDAHTGEILSRNNEVCYVNVVGTTTGNVEDFGYCYAEQDLRMPNMKVNITGGGSGFSNLNGDYNINNAGTAPVTVTAQCDGRWINVNDQLDGDATFTGIATPGVPFEIRWNDATGANDAERDAYLHGNRIHDKLKSYDPSWPSPDFRMSANVNINASCNAFWNGSSINFYRAGGGCGNTGQMGDVIYHEYGHGITQWIYGGNPDDVGEGNSDIVAFFIDGNSIVGEGFYLNNCASGIRDSNNNLRYPDDYTGQGIHFKGQIIAGFWWDAREVLLTAYTLEQTTDLLWNNWHFGRRALQPITMPDQVETAFIMDDDDGDLTNGTPNYFAYCPAADHHGFTPPGPTPHVTITHVPVHNQVFDGNPDVVTATVTSDAAPIDPSTVKLRYQVNDGSVIETGMTPAGPPGQYQGTVPVQPVGSHIDYNMVARDLNGNAGAYPPSFCTPDTPSGSERFYIATSVDELEVNSGWVVGAAGDNATTGVWERIDPNGTAAQPENDKTPAPGVYAFITGQCLPGCGLGDSDIDGGTTTLTSPLYDLSASTTAKVVYYRWYSNDTGAAPGTDYWVVDASNDGGTNWSSVENTNVTAARWTPIESDLNALFGGTAEMVKFRFKASDLNDGSLVEAGVDEFMVFVDYAADAPDDESLSGVRHYALHPARPNPFGVGTEISFDVPASMTVSVQIHDVSGKRVRSLASGAAVGAGQHALYWDGRDEAGRELPSGVYYVQLRTQGFAADRKVVLER